MCPGAVCCGAAWGAGAWGFREPILVVSGLQPSGGHGLFSLCLCSRAHAGAGSWEHGGPGQSHPRSFCSAGARLQQASICPPSEGQRAACPCPGQRGSSSGCRDTARPSCRFSSPCSPRVVPFSGGYLQDGGWGGLVIWCWGQPQDPAQPPAVPLLRATCSLLFAAASLQQGCARLQPPTACSPLNKGGSEPPLPLGTLQQSPSLRQQKPFPVPEPAAAPFPSPAPSSPLPQPALPRGLQPAWHLLVPVPFLGGSRGPDPLFGGSRGPGHGGWGARLQPAARSGAGGERSCHR